MSDYLKFTKPLPVEYLSLQNKYSKLYGKKTLVIIQVGSFHEVYGTQNQGYNLKELGDLLGVVVTKKNKKEPLGLKNPNMIGFPIVATMKFINILIENNFTIVKIDQVTEPPKPKRQVTGIFSPGTNIDNITKPESNNILSIFLEEIKQSKDNYLFATGLSVIDLSTGKSILHEAYSNSKDKFFALDEINKFINYYLPKETIICFNTLKTKSEKELLKYLELEDKVYHKIDYNKEFSKISYQNQFFENIFKNKSVLNIFDYLDLENINYARISYVKLLNYCQEHISTITNNIEKPDIFIENRNLYLGNNALIQLDIFSNDKTKNNSLFNILDYTKTSMGKRYLNKQIVSPLIIDDEISKRYNDIELLSSNQINLEINNILKNIHDTERLHRKLKLSTLNPFEVLVILDDYNNLLNLIKLFKLNNIYNNFFSDDFEDNLLNLNKYYNNLFDLDVIEGISFAECTTSFYKTGIYKEIDNIQNEIDNYNKEIKLIEKSFSDLIEEKKKYFKEDSQEEKLSVQINKTDKEGLFLTTTKKRFEQIKKKLKNKNIEINNLIITENDLQVKIQSNSVKIFIKQLSDLSNKISSKCDKIKPLLIKSYKNDLLKILTNFGNLMNLIVEKISYIDFINSGANLAIYNNFCKPEIADYDKSFLDAKNLRHAIIEQISDYAYVPHNICLGKELNGILLYGVNSSGKSSLMKAIGIAIIIAQIGYYVPADSFTYKPYESLITRISGNDNLFKGLSSYTLEIYEIKNILKRINNKTLVIADEVCKGTEHNSALIIVMTLLETLNKNKSSFITATHLHELIDFERMSKLDKIKAFHLHVDFDEKNRKLIYDRILREGNGRNEYGLDVAKCIMDDDDFINLAEVIKSEYDKQLEIVVPKKSTYNSKLYITDCYFCNSRENLETHHINFQKDTDKNGFIAKEGKNHIHKNHLSNLIVLCEKCHDKIHNNEIELKGIVETSMGKKII